MINVHDIVTLKNATENVPAKSSGTVVYEYCKGVFEVEFIVNGRSICETLIDTDINLVFDEAKTKFNKTLNKLN